MAAPQEGPAVRLHGGGAIVSNSLQERNDGFCTRDIVVPNAHQLGCAIVGAFHHVERLVKSSKNLAHFAAANGCLGRNVSPRAILRCDGGVVDHLDLKLIASMKGSIAYFFQNAISFM